MQCGVKSTIFYTRTSPIQGFSSYADGDDLAFPPLPRPVEHIERLILSANKQADGAASSALSCVTRDASRYPPQVYRCIYKNIYADLLEWRGAHSASAPLSASACEVAATSRWHPAQQVLSYRDFLSLAGYFPSCSCSSQMPGLQTRPHNAPINPADRKTACPFFPFQQARGFLAWGGKKKDDEQQKKSPPRPPKKPEKEGEKGLQRVKKPKKRFGL